MTPAPPCVRCGHARGPRFRFDVAGAAGLLCPRCGGRDRALVRRSLRVALVVGTILTAINQGGAIVTGARTWSLAWKIPLTYTVPFVVAMWGALTSLRQRG